MKNLNGKTVQQYLSEDYLFDQVSALAGMIGPRPAGTRSELLARQYVRHALNDLGIEDSQISEEPLKAHESWGWPLIAATGAAAAANLMPRRLGFLTGWASLAASASTFATFTARKTPLNDLMPAGDTANLIVKIKPTGEVKNRVVLLGHLDSNKERLTFSKTLRPYLRIFATASVVILFLNGLSHLLGWGWLRRLTFLKIVSLLAALVADEIGSYVPGANDNASAVACLLGLAGQLNETPLANTEVWVVFTAAEEVGSLGLHALLDNHPEELANAHFIDFEMVGAGDIAYITDHSGLVAFANYRPDHLTLAYAVETARENPELGVKGVPMTIIEEVAVLRTRGYRGLCLVGVGEDGWPVNWHRSEDAVVNITPKSIERAATFAWKLVQKIDGKSNA